MQKRRVGGGGDASLPMTVGDGAAATTTRRRRKKKRHGRSIFLCNTTFASVAIIMVMIFLSAFVMKMILDGHNNSVGGGGGSMTKERQTLDQHINIPGNMNMIGENKGGSNIFTGGKGLFKLPLSKFSTLSYALENADIVALYFAASWCPMSTPITKALDVAFSGKGILLPPLSNDGTNTKIKHEKRHRLAIVYISSDSSEEEMTLYAKQEWNVVPYESSERNEIKRHFSTCAKKEMDDLHINPRKHEIPTLILIDSLTHGVLSTSGVEDIKKNHEKALDEWAMMEQLARSMEEMIMV
uniref:Thioredoxin-like fold domain-containing protein n=1 Tax=Ditylum brightwellii TaxID=49249 RepID=A0A6U3TBU0_9STRA